MDPMYFRINAVLMIVVFVALFSAGCSQLPSGSSITPTETPVTTTSPSATPDVKITSTRVTVTNSYEDPVRNTTNEEKVTVYRPYGSIQVSSVPDSLYSLSEVTAYSDPEGVWYITGKLKNKGRLPLKYLTITYNYYNKKNEVLGSVYASTDYLGGGPDYISETWKFTTTPIRDKNYAHYNFADVIGLY